MSPIPYEGFTRSTAALVEFKSDGLDLTEWRHIFNPKVQKSGTLPCCSGALGANGNWFKLALNRNYKRLCIPWLNGVTAVNVCVCVGLCEREVALCRPISGGENSVLFNLEVSMQKSMQINTIMNVVFIVRYVGNVIITTGLIIVLFFSVINSHLTTYTDRCYQAVLWVNTVWSIYILLFQ